MTRLNASRTLIAILLTSLAVLPLITEADQQDTQGPSLEGTVSSISGTTIKILNDLVVVQAANATITSDQDNRALALRDIKVGTIIDIRLSGAPFGGPLAAARIQVHGPKADGKIEGTIESVDLSRKRFSVLGLTIFFSDATIFDGNDNTGGDNGTGGTDNSASPASVPGDLAVGKPVDAEVVIFNGTLLATRISLNNGGAGDQQRGAQQARRTTR